MGKLSGIRVLDLSRVLSGPFCTALLADLGAEVIKIESPGGGDDSRRFGPFVNGASVYFALINRNKKSVTLNLKHARAREVVTELARRADVVVENFRPGVAARLGLDYRALKEANSGLVYLSISGFGQSGPRAEAPAYDLIIQAMSGLMSTTGFPDGPPTCVGESIADLWTGMLGSWAVLAALVERAQTGRGEHIDLAMFDSLLAMQVTALSQFFASGHAPPRVGNRHPITTPVDAYATRDGYVVLVAPSDAHFAALAEVIGQPVLADDERFRKNAERRERVAELRAIIEGWSRGRSTEEAIAALRARDIPAGPVWDLQQALGSDQAAARELVHHVPHPVLGSIGILPQPAKFQREPAGTVTREPLLGEHTDEVLGSLLGMTSGDVQRLRAEGVV